MNTNRESVRTLCKTLVTRLENKEMVSFAPRLRNIVQDEVYNVLSPWIMTEEDIRDRTADTIQGRQSALDGAPGTDHDRYKAARSVILSRFPDGEINGLYLRKPLIELGKLVAEYLMRSSNIDDVFETDDVIQQFVVDWVKQFKPGDAH